MQDGRQEVGGVGSCSGNRITNELKVQSSDTCQLADIRRYAYVKGLVGTARGIRATSLMSVSHSSKFASDYLLDSDSDVCIGIADGVAKSELLHECSGEQASDTVIGDERDGTDRASEGERARAVACIATKERSKGHVNIDDFVNVEQIRQDETSCVEGIESLSTVVGALTSRAVDTREQMHASAYSARNKCNPHIEQPLLMKFRPDGLFC